MSTVAGFQAPEIPFSELAGSVGTFSPAQIVKDDPKLNAGVTFGLMVTVSVAVVAHKPAVGVKV